uniref:F-box domain-containing protein n=1 Tax=Oryza glumipatula TaxID=40148 RepID=A0A0E0AG30_9ORYZ
MMKRKKWRLQLSNLPEDILCTIVSKLPLREAARTSILSSQWNRTWCSHTNLNLSYRSIMSRRYIESDITPEGRKLNAEEFIRRVDAILQQHNGGGVEKIEVIGLLENENAYHINGWVNFAIKSKTKQLVLDFRSFHWPIDEPYNFAFQIFDAANMENLQSLKLGSISLKPPADFKGFQNLKRLKLLDVGITDEDLQLLLSDCNCLEFLGIYCCKLITSLRTTHLSTQLKHLYVYECPCLKEIELNSGLTTLEYIGPLIPLAPPGIYVLTNLRIKSWDISDSLQYIFTELPSTLPRLEMLTLQCRELERITLPDKPIKFIYLKHLRLELAFSGPRKWDADILDFACILEAAPLMEKLEFHMWMNCRDHLRYRKAHGKLRTLPPCPHYHLKEVNIAGFYGQKDQLELAHHILRNSVVLQAMNIDPRPIAACDRSRMAILEAFNFVDGSKVAMKYLCKADHRNVVHVSDVSRKDVENVPAYRLVSPFWIEFDKTKRSGLLIR